MRFAAVDYMVQPAHIIFVHVKSPNVPEWCQLRGDVCSLDKSALRHGHETASAAPPLASLQVSVSFCLQHDPDRTFEQVTAEEVEFLREFSESVSTLHIIL